MLLPARVRVPRPTFDKPPVPLINTGTGPGRVVVAAHGQQVLATTLPPAAPPPEEPTDGQRQLVQVSGCPGELASTKSAAEALEAVPMRESAGR